MELEHLQSDLERGIEKDRLSPFPRWLLLDRLPPSVPVVAIRSGSFLETVFGFLAIVLPSVPVVAGDGGPPGRVWEGATAPLPIERDVSEANSFLGGWETETLFFAAMQQSYPQARLVI